MFRLEKLLSILLPFFCVAVTAQVSPKTGDKIGVCGELKNLSDLHPQQLLVNEKNDYFTDRFGNIHLRQINPNSTENLLIPITPDYVSPEQLFAVYLKDDIQDPDKESFITSPAFRNTLAQIFADLEQIIDENPRTKEPVKFEVTSMYVNSSVLASAGSYYNYNGIPAGVITEGEVWKAINTGTNNPDEWDGNIRVNFFHDWYANANNPGGISGTGKFDMYAVLLHEILHALGFASGINADGSPKNGRSYTTYDKLLHTATDDLLLPTGNTWSFNPALGNEITAGCPGPSNIRLGSENLVVHAPQVYSRGSSISHVDLDNDCTYPIDDYIMAYAVTTETPRRIHNDEFKVLCDLDYSLSGQYGNPNVVEFGNPAVVTSISNNNVINYSGCSPIVIGVDDYTDPNTRPIVENCKDSVLEIQEQDILANDIGTDLEVYGLVTSGGTAIPFTGVTPNRTFQFAIEGAGEIQLRYQPRDKNGHYGKYTYVNIKVVHCPGLDCVNTDPCNLICNPHFVDLSPEQYNPDEFNMVYHLNDDHNPGEIEGWYTYNGSPSFYDFNIPCTGTQCGILNYVDLPGSPGGAMALWGCSETQGKAGESVLAYVSVKNQTDYILSLHTMPWTTYSERPYEVYLSEASRIINNPTRESCQEGLNLFENMFLIAKEETIEDHVWKQSIFSFTSDNDYETLILNVYGGLSSTAYFDYIELIEDKFINNTANIQTTYSLICGQSATLGIDNLCTVNGLIYQFWDVTDPQNEFQLTSTTNTDVYAVSDLYASKVQLNNIMNNVDIEMRRVFAESNGVPISHNNANAILPITITVSPEKPIDATFMTVTDTNDCFTYTFEANTIYETHEWDFNSDGTPEVSGEGTDIANTKPIYTFSTKGTYKITHTVHNECGSIKYTETIKVCNDCTVTYEVGPVKDLENCADQNGQAVFDLTVNDALAINGQSGLTVSYYTTETNADTGTNPIANPTSYTVSSDDTIYVRIEDGNDCYDVGNFEVVITALAVDMSITQQVCSGEATLTAVGTFSSGAIYLWELDGSTLTETSNTLIATESGDYTLTVTDGCSGSVTKEVTVTSALSVDMSITQQACSGEATLTAVGTFSSGATYVWELDGSTLAETSSTLITTESGDYILTVTDGCSGSVTKEVTVTSALSVDMSITQQACSGEATLTAAGTFSSGATYVWELDGTTLAETSSTLITTESGDYTVTVTDGCTGSTSQNIKITSQPEITILDDIQICSAYELPTIANGTYYTGSNATGTQLDAGTEIYNSQTIYIYAGMPECNNESSFMITILEGTPLVINAQSVQAFSENNSVTVEVESEGTYEYSLDSGIFQNSNVFEDLTSGTHEITVCSIDSCSCETIEICIMGYPKYFTPNGDGIHDTWNLNTSSCGTIKIKNLYIFNRFGKLIKALQPGGLGWDGTYNGKNMPTSDYWFKVVYKENGTLKEFTANFSLIR